MLYICNMLIRSKPTPTLYPISLKNSIHYSQDL